MIENEIEVARQATASLGPEDPRRVVALGRLALADELVRQARAAVLEALDEVASDPREIAPDDTFRVAADVLAPADGYTVQGEIGVKAPTETVTVEQSGWSG